MKKKTAKVGHEAYIVYKKSNQISKLFSYIFVECFKLLTNTVSLCLCYLYLSNIVPRNHEDELFILKLQLEIYHLPL